LQSPGSCSDQRWTYDDTCDCKTY